MSAAEKLDRNQQVTRETSCKAARTARPSRTELENAQRQLRLKTKKVKAPNLAVLPKWEDEPQVIAGE